MAGGIFAFPRFLPTGEEEGMGAGRYTRLVFRERSTDLRGGKEGGNENPRPRSNVKNSSRSLRFHERSPRFSTLRLLHRRDLISS